MSVAGEDSGTLKMLSRFKGFSDGIGTGFYNDHEFRHKNAECLNSD